MLRPALVVQGDDTDFARNFFCWAMCKTAWN